MVADFAFGVADAARRRHFRCRMLWHGALKFLYYMAYIGIVDMVNASLSRSFGGVYMPFLNLFIVYLIITDAVSVIAHMQRLGIPVPDLLRRVLLRASGRWSGGWMRPWAGTTMTFRPLGGSDLWSAPSHDRVCPFTHSFGKI